MDLAPLIEAGPIVMAHAAAASAAFGLGVVQLASPKGGMRHRIMGRAWVGLLALAALSSFAISGIRQIGPFSAIHAISLATLIVLIVAVAQARAGRIEAHRWTMIGLFAGALVITGAFTLAPGRVMHAVVFGPKPQNDARTPPNTLRPTPG